MFRNLAGPSHYRSEGSRPKLSDCCCGWIFRHGGQSPVTFWRQLAKPVHSLPRTSQQTTIFKHISLAPTPLAHNTPSAVAMMLPVIFRCTARHIRNADSAIQRGTSLARYHEMTPDFSAENREVSTALLLGFQGVPTDSSAKIGRYPLWIQRAASIAGPLHP